MMDREKQFIAAVHSEGYFIPPSVKFDGRFHRVNGYGTGSWCYRWDEAEGKAFYRRFNEPWRCWNGGARRLLTDAERAEIDAARVREREKRREKQRTVALKAAELWAAGKPAPEAHPYLTAKGISPEGCRLAPDGRLMVPVRAGKGLSSIQFIGADGQKSFLAGGAVAGCCALLGEYAAGRIYIAEGFATAASVRKATGAPVAVAFSAGNLRPVAMRIRAKLPDAEIIICGDADLSGVGQAAATAAAAAVGGSAVVPPVWGDFNDFARDGGDITAFLPGSRRRRWYGKISAEEEVIPWLLPDMLARKGVTMIFGASGSGKSFVAMDIAFAVASGGIWNGRMAEYGGVLYISGSREGASWEMAKRMRAQSEARDFERAEPRGLWKPEQTPLMWESMLGNIDETDGKREIEEALKAFGSEGGIPPSLIIIDTVSGTMGGDQNSNTAAVEYMVTLKRLQAVYAPDSALLLIHHGQDKVRGATQFFGDSDFVFRVSKTSGTGKVAVIHNLKRRGGEPIKPMYFTLRGSADSAVPDYASRQAVQKAAQQKEERKEEPIVSVPEPEPISEPVAEPEPVAAPEPEPKERRAEKSPLDLAIGGWNLTPEQKFHALWKISGGRRTTEGLPMIIEREALELLIADGINVKTARSRLSMQIGWMGALAKRGAVIRQEIEGRAAFVSCNGELEGA